MIGTKLSSLLHFIIEFLSLHFRSKHVTPRSRNTYLVAYSDFSIVFFDLLPVFVLYYEFFIWLFCLGSGFVDSESALFRICHSCDANPASAIPRLLISRRDPRVCDFLRLLFLRLLSRVSLSKPASPWKYPTLVFSPFFSLFAKRELHHPRILHLMRRSSPCRI